MDAIVRRVDRSEWQLLRKIRLRALRDAPYAFGSTLEYEANRDNGWWATSAERLAWFVAVAVEGIEGIEGVEGVEAVGLIAVMPADEERKGSREVISMWVAPTHRGTGTAERLLAAVVGWAEAGRATELRLRVSDGNLRARRFYERAGFTPTGAREPLRSDPSLSTAEMRLSLPSSRRARLRFAPTPAGDLHVGHVRAAVLTWIVARQLGGDYFVRFENTDRAKERPGSREAIVADLEWLGLLGAEPPHDQAEMTDSYRQALDRLAAGGHTYTDDGAVRFRTPGSGTVEWEDLVRGRVAVGNEDLDDPVLARSSGTPTFYLASTVDDGEDGISHLIRADPMRRATAKQLHIWRALEVEPPRAGHLPLVTGPGGGPVRLGVAAATVRALRERGILAAALVMYLAMPETASWKTPPAGIEDIAERVDLRRLPRRPTSFDRRALEVLNRRVAVARGDRRGGD